MCTYLDIYASDVHGADVGRREVGKGLISCVADQLRLR